MAFVEHPVLIIMFGGVAAFYYELQARHAGVGCLLRGMLLPAFWHLDEGPQKTSAFLTPSPRWQSFAGLILRERIRVTKLNAWFSTLSYSLYVVRSVGLLVIRLMGGLGWLAL